ncbi:ATP-binding cassette domain-containing protein [Vibrio sp. SM6]|uniref:ATP-binding cassette domain-containing protein n=1 Tax=Vibrio agarilyticus TaxID=2726741 RepID=A0A7X8YIC3_9VIBR|nr:ATP-binding cassette domain-containing protein [Vibrio agarilyticus]NLS14426.1 ATP-binding cassette domain-containing protein [Vibrio agarilyticus]
MSILIDFSNIQQRLADFESEAFQERYEETPLLRGLAYTLIALEWEGTPTMLSDAFVVKNSAADSFNATIERLGYRCEHAHLSSLTQLNQIAQPCFIEIDHLSAIFLGCRDDQAILFDYTNNDTLLYPLKETPCTLISISEYSKLFREPPPETHDKDHWLRHHFYRYHNEIKSLFLLSFIISLLGAVQPFFIMAVYNFALSSGSSGTLYWLALFAVIVALSEYGFKRMRVNIIATSGKALAVHISQQVVAKLLWLPYAKTSQAGISAQLARLKDIDTFRRLATADSTISYFDMPFVLVFIIAIAILSPTAAMVVIAGLALMLIYCFYARYRYSQATARSTRANALVSYQWNEALSRIKTLQGLPLMRIIQARLKAALRQSSDDAERVTTTNSKIQVAGSSLIQIIGTTTIVATVLGVLDGAISAGAMLATVILVWKALGPIMGIYNALTKFQILKASATQINHLMAMSDDQFTLQKSPPIRRFDGRIEVNHLHHRFTGAVTGLTNLGFSLPVGQKVVISGPSGCGKTTLISIIAGLETRYQGAVTLDGYNIRQFNNYRYRTSINYIPFDLHIFEGSVETNFIMHNGLIPTEQMQAMLDFFELGTWLDKGLATELNAEKVSTLPNGVQQRLRLAIGLGNHNAAVVIIDEPFCGCELENTHYFNKLFSDKLNSQTVLFASNDPSLIATSTMSLVLDKDGNLKYCGSTDKYLTNLNRSNRIAIA